MTYKRNGVQCGFCFRYSRKFWPVAYPGIFVRGVGVQKIQLSTEDRENGDLGGGSSLVRVSGGSCNLVQDISFHFIQ